MILAGGRGSRMGYRDKGEIILGGKRMIEHVTERLTPQDSLILISGPHDYGLGVSAIPDEESGIQGPAAGLSAILSFVQENYPEADGFYTVPVDCPFFPEDLITRLDGPGGSYHAVDETGPHPTFAYWACDALKSAFENLDGEQAPSLRRLLFLCGSQSVTWHTDHAFFNINTSSDIEQAERLITPS
ncbi:molybdenum cofactor guanylyltransferase [Parvularcula marina]|uniref:molybdenum cofactor guanylyltransferase n=1 Tax=Parvularcula marina TaxID=2292771 RepID=UPI001314DDA4|nr:NTP transferase domain-containing protein [Parvularcula marina]